jgi:hypothetical protein
VLRGVSNEGKLLGPKEEMPRTGGHAEAACMLPHCAAGNMPLVNLQGRVEPGGQMGRAAKEAEPKEAGWRERRKGLSSRHSEVWRDEVIIRSASLPPVRIAPAAGFDLFSFFFPWVYLTDNFERKEGKGRRTNLEGTTDSADDSNDRAR